VLAGEAALRVLAGGLRLGALIGARFDPSSFAAGGSRNATGAKGGGAGDGSDGSA
jgi:hypothetical protein